ncbi:cupin domain-containing protein [Martelella sp. AD-3]|uniref:cupin domain-containing protein n=1 Tax=Martelella sp. AD-3 TaxID=686597 RepID=UPI000467CDA5|nr:cupin domain-containing protein [Martelella sp. AD-3]AMM84787.1 hypothetical protein AZF01_10820 [Martelella sp. AD-3]MAM09317.1 cupin domain-containing protein [Rhizobiaceae bacterium]
MQYDKSFHKPPSTVHFLGNLLTFRASAGDTDGIFSVAECLSAPGAGAPMHHQKDSEAFLVMEGAVEFVLNGDVRRCGKGDFLYVRPGDVHAFRNAGPTVSRIIIINLPAGPHEDFFRAVGDPVASETETFPEIAPPDMQKLLATAEQFGIHILPPETAAQQ